MSGWSKPLVQIVQLDLAPHPVLRFKSFQLYQTFQSLNNEHDHAARARFGNSRNVEVWRLTEERRSKLMSGFLHRGQIHRE